MKSISRYIGLFDTFKDRRRNFPDRGLKALTAQYRQQMMPLPDRKVQIPWNEENF